jgi:ATP-dependent helicase/nuclease subunit A
MTQYLQRGSDKPSLETDQSAVVKSYHDGTGRVAVGAGAGTGKTTTLMDVVGEAVLQELFAVVPDDVSIEEWLDQQTEIQFSNPFEEILLTTFSNDAANELKTRLKRRLREHEQAVDYTLPVSIWSWIETGSTISTIDSFFHELFTEIAPELGISPDFDVQSQLELQTIKEEIMYDLRQNHTEKVRNLKNAYPAEEWRAYPPDDLETMLAKAQQRCREYCITPREAADSLLENLDRGHAGITPPYTMDDITAIVSENVQEDPAVRAPDPDTEREFVTHVENTYERSRELASDFGELLIEYDKLYDEYTREEGQFSHLDITHHLYEFLRENPNHPFTQALGSRYQHVFVDEFQDTSYAQTVVLSEFITDNPDPTNYLLIGDVKQSIYEWRSAEPAIFGRLLEHARGNGDHSDLPLATDDLTHQPLTSNFRSHPHIIGAVNEVFDDVFDHPGRGAMGDVPIEYTPLDAKRGTTQESEPHVHVLNRGFETKKDPWINQESTQAAETVAGILENEDIRVDRNPFTEDMTLEPAQPGDITFLFRRRSYLPQYADALRERGIGVAVNLDDDLFDQTEVELVIDLLDWFANPHSKPSLLRIIRSPMVAVADSTIRALVAHGSSIPTLLEEWPDSLPEADRNRLASLIKLRDDLRWEREGSKTELIHRIYRHSGFDTVLLADTDALRRYGNLWLLAEVVSQWEEEELLSYREFINKLQRLRDPSDSDGESDYSVVSLADESDTDTVTLTTIHAAKGREFPIVFAIDLIHRLNYPRPQKQRFLSKRTEGFTLRPRAAEQPCPDTCSFPTPDSEANVWLSEDFDADFADCTGPIWLSDERSNSGKIAYPNPLNEYLKPQISESWRMLYVALTRATDHLFMGLGEDEPYNGKWTTWMCGIRDSLSENGKWPDNLSYSLLTEPSNSNSEDQTEPVPIGVDDVSPGEGTEEETPNTDGMDVFLDADGPTPRVETVPFIPNKITPNSLHTLIECPRRYQYHHVQQVTDIRHPEHEEATTPGTIEAMEWGTLVHRALEQFIHNGRDASLGVFQHENQIIQTAFKNGILAEFTSSLTWDQVSNYCDEEDILTEHELQSCIDIDGVDVQVRGKADLLYRSENDWHIVDFKTASFGDIPSYLKQKHERQVLTYAWLIEEIYGISPASRTVHYLGDGVEKEYNGEITEFEDLISEAMARVDFDESGALNAIPNTGSSSQVSPDSRCGTCPYSAARGGPCEHGDEPN